MPQEIDADHPTVEKFTAVPTWSVYEADHDNCNQAIELLQAAIADQRQDIESLQRLYARTLNQCVTYERTIDVVRAECNRLLEENRQQRADLVQLRGAR